AFGNTCRRMYVSIPLFYYYLLVRSSLYFFFFFNPPAPTDIYTLSLHDALPISSCNLCAASEVSVVVMGWSSAARSAVRRGRRSRSEEHTSELQSPYDLVCRLLLEKKKKKKKEIINKQPNTQPRDRPHAPDTQLH